MNGIIRVNLKVTAKNDPIHKEPRSNRHIVQKAQLTENTQAHQSRGFGRIRLFPKFRQPMKDVERKVGEPLYYVEPSGRRTEVLSADFAFRDHGKTAKPTPARIPANLWELGMAGFQNEISAFSGQLSKLHDNICRSLGIEIPSENAAMSFIAMQQLAALDRLTLDNQAVAKREDERRKSPDFPDVHPLVNGLYVVFCKALDVMYPDTPLKRFWTLEVVARMPYFAFDVALHLYETLGLTRAVSELRRVHFAEEWNEMHHLQIMESLGGDTRWIDRFWAQHGAMVYFWVLLVVYLCAPKHSYDFCTLIEIHAYETYSQFVEENEAILQSLPAPLCAVQYYRNWDSFSLSAVDRGPSSRPPCDTLLHTFTNVRNDEGEHVQTMHACATGKLQEALEAAADQQQGRVE